MDIDRRTSEDRRKVNLLYNKVERRKRPDRRTSGFDVRDMTLSEEDFSYIFALYLV